MQEFKVTRYRIRTGSGSKMPEQPFSAVLLSDLHNVSYGEGNERLLQEIRNENPEFILAAGDILTAGDVPQMDAAMALMDELTKKYPVYYANGNHEHRMKINTEKYGGSYARYVNAIRSYGVHLLENGCERIEVRKMPIAVWGLELDGKFFRKGKKETLDAGQLRELLGEPDGGAFNILLAHHPVYAEAYADWGADLTLSGHLHGGIVRLPYFGGMISPQLRPFPKYDRGMYDVRGKKLIVSAGLGSHTIPLRINNPPQLIVIDFV